MTTLGEDLLLLLLDDATGVVRQPAQTQFMISAALPVELAMSARVRLEGDQIVVCDRSRVGQTALDEALQAIVAHGATVGCIDWIHGRRLEAFEAARRGLLDRGLVEERRRRVLGLFPTVRYPQKDATVEADLRRQLTEAVLHGTREPDDRLRALVQLLRCVGLQSFAVPGADRAVVGARLDDIVAGDWENPELERFVLELVRLVNDHSARSLMLAFVVNPVL